MPSGAGPLTVGGTVVGGVGAATAVWLSGRCDSATAGAVRDRLHAAVGSGQGPLVVDMSNVDSLDAVGLGVLVGTQRLAAQRDRSLVLRGTPERLARLLRVIGLDRVLPTMPAEPARTAQSPAA
jgi:anti-sigma B factor antagonist